MSFFTRLSIWLKAKWVNKQCTRVLRPKLSSVRLNAHDCKILFVFFNWQCEEKVTPGRKMSLPYANKRKWTNFLIYKWENPRDKWWVTVHLSSFPTVSLKWNRNTCFAITHHRMSYTGSLANSPSSEICLYGGDDGNFLSLAFLTGNKHKQSKANVVHVFPTVQWKHLQITFLEIMLLSCEKLMESSQWLSAPNCSAEYILIGASLQGGISVWCLKRPDLKSYSSSCLACFQNCGRRDKYHGHVWVCVCVSETQPPAPGRPSWSGSGIKVGRLRRRLCRRCKRWLDSSGRGDIGHSLHVQAHTFLPELFHVFPRRKESMRKMWAWCISSEPHWELTHTHLLHLCSGLYPWTYWTVYCVKLKEVARKFYKLRQPVSPELTFAIIVEETLTREEQNKAASCLAGSQIRTRKKRRLSPAARPTTHTPVECGSSEGSDGENGFYWNQKNGGKFDFNRKKHHASRPSWKQLVKVRKITSADRSQAEGAAVMCGGFIGRDKVSRKSTGRRRVKMKMGVWQERRLSYRLDAKQRFNTSQSLIIYLIYRSHNDFES